MIRRLERAQSGVVLSSLVKKRAEVAASAALEVGLVCSLVAALVGVDWYLQLSAWYLSEAVASLVQYAQPIILGLLTAFAALCIALAIAKLVAMDNVKLTALQKALLGVKPDSIGFETVFAATPFGSPITPKAPQRSSPLQYMTPTKVPPSLMHSSPQNDRYFTPSASPSQLKPFQTVSKLSPSKIGYFDDLDCYLKSEEVVERMVLTGHSQEQHPSPASQWYNSRAGTTKRYHTATSQSHKPGSSSEGEAAKPFNDLVLSGDKLELYTERCRKWLAGTLLQPVAKEIQSINASLRKNGNSELQIGTTDLGTLRRVSKSKLLCIPSINMLLPYLELTTKQDYLVQRITELAQGDCLSTFRWNSGGFWKGRSWDQDLPNDSQILMHMLCVYLDSHMDIVSHASPQRVFSSQYYLKAPETPSAKKSDLCLYQAVANPPHFKVLVQDSCFDPLPGRSNMFHAIINFLLRLKSRKHEQLRQVSRNLSELNIYWIIDEE